MTAIITFTDGEVVTIKNIKKFKTNDNLLVLQMEKGSYIYPLHIVSLFIITT